MFRWVVSLPMLAACALTIPYATAATPLQPAATTHMAGTPIINTHLAGAPSVGKPPTAASTSGAAGDGPSYGPELQGFTYPYPVHHFEFRSQGESMQMAYMDVLPTGTANGGVVVLMHGKYFCSATWQNTIEALTAAGWRVIAPDQIGFCKSSKPVRYQFSLQQLASNTYGLLQFLGVQNPIIVGHSIGGMLAIRYALMYPEDVTQLVLVNPLGLEDWKAMGVPSLGVDGWLARESRVSETSIHDHAMQAYFNGHWRPAYDRWVDMLAGMYRGPGRDQVAWDSALINDMVYTQPVVYELPLIRVPTLLLVGTEDSTALARDAAASDAQQSLGDYKVLAPKAAATIPHARLVEFKDLGHVPQLEAPDRFNAALLQGLLKPGTAPTVQ